MEISIENVLKFWVEDKPNATNERVVALFKLAKIEIKKASPGIENRIYDEDILTTVEYILSAAMQRAWNDDFSGRDSANWTQGPFATGFSKNGKRQTGIYFTEDELTSIRDESKSYSPFVTIRRVAEPNFNVYETGYGCSHFGGCSCGV